MLLNNFWICGNFGDNLLSLFNLSAENFDQTGTFLRWPLFSYFFLFSIFYKSFVLFCPSQIKTNNRLVCFLSISLCQTSLVTWWVFQNRPLVRFILNIDKKVLYSGGHYLFLQQLLLLPITAYHLQCRDVLSLQVFDNCAILLFQLYNWCSLDTIGAAPWLPLFLVSVLAQAVPSLPVVSNCLSAGTHTL